MGVAVEGFCTATGRVQRSHEQPFERFNEGIVVDEVMQHGDYYGGMAEAQLDLRPLHGRLQPPPLPATTHLRGPASRQSSQRLSTPQMQSLRERASSIGVGAFWVATLVN
jgi:hypothetical protein